MRYMVAILLIVACRTPTAPHEADTSGPEIIGAVQITDAATLDTVRYHFNDVSKCLGVLPDDGSFRLASFYEADDVILASGRHAGGVRVGEYLYAVMGEHRPSFWRSMRHEMIHYITNLGHPEADPLIDRCKVPAG